jgi:hypothetical protein
MKIQDIFTAYELALIDSGDYKPGRAVLDAKLDLAMALEREACAKVCEAQVETGAHLRCAAAIRSRSNT